MLVEISMFTSEINTMVFTKKHWIFCLLHFF